MKKKSLVAALMCLVFIISVIPVIGQTSGEADGPYRLATTYEEVMAAMRMRCSRIIVTDVDVPEIRNGEVNGIIITEQDINEALAVLNEVYYRWNYVIYNMVTPSVNFSRVPTPEEIYDLVVRYLARQEKDGLFEEYTAIMPFGPSPPTVVTRVNRDWNWSGTVNFTHTRYINPPNTFIDTQALTPHRVELRARSNGALLSVHFPQRTGMPCLGATFYTHFSLRSSVYFYAELHNMPHGNTAQRAHWWIRMF